MPTDLITAHEAECWVLYNLNPGLKQHEIAARFRVKQSRISKILASADKKITAMKQLVAEAHGDPDVVNQTLIRIADQAQKRQRAA